MDSVLDNSFLLNVQDRVVELLFHPVWLALLVLLVVVSFITLKHVLFKSSKKLPPVAPSIPFVGPVLEFVTDPLRLATKCWKRLGDCFTIKLFGFRLTFLVGPEAQAAFFKPSDDELSQQEAYNFSIPLFGPGVIYGAKPDVRAQQIKLAHGNLRADRIRSYVPMMVEEATAYFDKVWGDSGEIDLNKSLSELIVLTATRCLMGPEVREHMFAQMESLLHTIDEGTLPITFFFPNLPIPKHWARDRAREQVIDIFRKVMEQRRASGNKGDDFLQNCMDYVYKNGGPLPAEHVGGLMIALLFAGQHTSSVTSSWTGLFLLRDKHKLVPALLKEQEEVLGGGGGDVTPEALKKMDLLHWCIKEALRMHPPLIFVMRKVLKEQTYKDMTIPVGDFVFASPALGGRDPSVFTNPDVFDPYRWGPGREEDKKHTYAWMGFGAGRHACLGEQFAYHQIKTIWTLLLRTYDMDLVAPFPKPCYSALVVGPTRPCTIRYKKRAASP